MQANDPPRRLGFGVFGVDLRDRQLTKRGLRIRLQEQPFQVLAMLLERPGEVVTRDELRNRLWPNTVVEFDHGLNKAISKIREVLGDSVESPRFVETVARRGYERTHQVADRKHTERREQLGDRVLVREEVATYRHGKVAVDCKIISFEHVADRARGKGSQPDVMAITKWSICECRKCWWG
jgi:DNA-binding winged helix-turn-helix (wHTH) protein